MKEFTTENRRWPPQDVCTVFAQKIRFLEETIQEVRGLLAERAEFSGLLCLLLMGGLCLLSMQHSVNMSHAKGFSKARNNYEMHVYENNLHFNIRKIELLGHISLGCFLVKVNTLFFSKMKKNH